LLDLLAETSGMAHECPPEISNTTRKLDRLLGEIVKTVATQALIAGRGALPCKIQFCAISCAAY